MMNDVCVYSLFCGMQTHIDWHGTHEIISGHNAMTEQTFYGPTPSTDDIYS